MSSIKEHHVQGTINRRLEQIGFNEDGERLKACTSRLKPTEDDKYCFLNATS